MDFVDEDRFIISEKGKRKLNFEVVVDELVDLIWRCIVFLLRVVSFILLWNNEGRIVQVLDKVLEKGDIVGVY